MVNHMPKHGLNEAIYKRDPGPVMKRQIYVIQLNSILLKPNSKALGRSHHFNSDVEALLVPRVMNTIEYSSLHSISRKCTETDKKQPFLRLLRVYDTYTKSSMKGNRLTFHLFH